MTRFGFLVSTVAAASAGLVGMGSLAHAAPVDVSNSGFEDPAVAEGDFNSGPTPGWGHGASSASHSSGIADPGADQGAGYVGENNYAQFTLNSAGPAEPGGYAIYFQNLDATIQPSTFYTLNLTVGNRQDMAFPTVGNGDTTGALFTHFGVQGGANKLNETATLVQSNAATVAPGQTATWTLKWETGENPTMQGSPLYIRLFALAEGDAVTSVLFDDVSVDISPVPEPAGAALLIGVGAALMGGRRRRHA